MDAAEIDSLHILPLRHLPLKTQSLRGARMVKNTRLESMVELFEERGTGSGQVPPHLLHDFFDFSGERGQDFDIICRLGELSSYDVYSLRVSLRKLGIAIGELEGLKLSEAKVAELTRYMNEFTRPLMRFVYGDDIAIDSLDDMVRLLADPNAVKARNNLSRMAYLLEVDLARIPKFLEDYADVYMSLSFYRQCLDSIAPGLAEIRETLRAIRRSRAFADDPALIHDSYLVEAKLHALNNDVVSVLDAFRARTEDMWENLSAEQYREMEELVLDHQSRIGEILCALTVKMIAWGHKFPERNDSQLAAKAAFLMSEIKYGLGRIEPLSNDLDAAAAAKAPRPAARIA